MFAQTPQHDKTLEQRLAEVSLLALELEGTLTDGAVYTDEQGHLSIRTLRRDLRGLENWRQQGGHVLVLARADLGPAQPWAEAAGVRLCAYRDKKDVALQMAALELEVQPYQVCYLGSDLDDLPALSLVGLAAAPADADPWVKGVAHLVLKNPGGAGVVRELVETILGSRQAVDGRE